MEKNKQHKIIYLFSFFTFVLNYLSVVISESTPSLNKLQNTKFSSYKVLLDSTRSFIVENDECFVIRINQLYQNIDISLENFNIAKLIITHTKIEEDESKYPVCPNNSTVCQEHIFPSKIIYSSKFCVLSTFIYGCANIKHDVDVNKNNTVSIVTKVNQKKPCIPLSTDNDKECASLGNNCDNNTACYNKCEKLSCYNYKENDNSTDTDSDNEANTDQLEKTQELNMCVPRSSDKQREALCRDVLSSSLNVGFSYKTCESSFSNKKDLLAFQKEANNAELKNQNNFLKVLCVIIGILIVLLLLSSLYYRTKIKESGVPPFTPPGFMPGFLFPKAKKENFLMGVK